jgi:hypothetical protein
MTNILPIPSNFNQVQQILKDADMKLSDMVKMKTATLKSLVGCTGGEKKEKVSAIK